MTLIKDESIDVYRLDIGNKSEMGAQYNESYRVQLARVCFDFRLHSASRQPAAGSRLQGVRATLPIKVAQQCGSRHGGIISQRRRRSITLTTTTWKRGGKLSGRRGGVVFYLFRRNDQSHDSPGAAKL